MDDLKHIDFVAALNRISDCMISIKDLDGIYLYCNEEFATGLGLEKEEVVGKKTREILFNQNPHLWEILHIDIDVIHQDKEILIERQLIHAERGGRWYKIRKMPLCDESGNIIAIFSEAIDITVEQEKIKKEKENIFRMRLKLLSTKQKEALMYFIESLSHKEIARKMNIDETTVSSYKYQIRNIMGLSTNEFNTFLLEVQQIFDT